MSNGKPTVSVSIPSRDEWKAVFGYSLLRMFISTQNANQNLRMCRGSVIPGNRNTLVNKALKDGATHVLFIDTDMVFPADTLDRLLAHGKSIVMANCCIRSLNPAKATAQRDGRVVWTEQGSTGLEEVHRCGFGVALIDIEVFESLPKPWFEFPYLPDRDDYGGEDVYFCDRAREAGYSLYIDHDLSKQIGHCGDLHYSFPMLWGDNPVETEVVEV
jgi:hypothetical protein